MDAKKELELRYLEEARRASSLFPSGEFVPHEPPDFLLATQEGTLGIEVTELCCQGPRGEAARLGNVARNAKRLYSKRLGAKPVSVGPVFSRDADDMPVEELATSLAQFVFDHRDCNDNFSWDGPEGLPKGYSLVGVFKPLESEPEGRWQYSRAFETTLAPKELLDARIEEKNRRLPEYRKVASEVWLLIVNDLFLGPGEVCLRSEDLARWTFDFAFDRVLLFARQPGGAGEVIELRSERDGGSPRWPNPAPS